MGIYNKKQFAKSGKGKIKDKSEWIIVENAHPALLTKGEFESLQFLRQFKIKRKGTISRFQSNNSHLLIGNPEVFTCKSCGSKIISSGDVYTCGRYNSNGKKGCGAPYFSVDSQWLETKVISEIEKITKAKNLKKHYKDFITQYKKNDTSKEDKSNLEKALSAKQKAQSNLIKTLGGMPDMNEFALKAITKELDQVSNEIELLKKQLKESTKVSSIELPTFEQFEREVYRAKSILTCSNFYEQKNMIWNFVEAITLDPIEREVNVIFNVNPYNVYLEKTKNLEKQMEGAFAPSMKLVAGAGFEPTTFGL